MSETEIKMSRHERKGREREREGGGGQTKTQIGGERRGRWE